MNLSIEHHSAGNTRPHHAMDKPDNHPQASVETHHFPQSQPLLSRRDALRFLGAGLLIGVTSRLAPAQSRAQPPGNRERGGNSQRRYGGRGGRGASTVSARVHIGADGVITVLTGKVECGQGARAELTQAAAQELRLPLDRVQLIMADTELTPDDGGTYGSQSTPSTVPAIRAGCAAARELLVAFAAQKWGIDAAKIEVRDGKVSAAGGKGALAYADLAADAQGASSLDAPVPRGISLTPVKAWTVMGAPAARPNGRDIVSGALHFPSDIVRPRMLYGKILRRPAYGAKLLSIDLAPAKAIAGALAFQDDQFVGVAAVGGVPTCPFADEVKVAAKSLKQTYHIAYIQHCPLEPRAATAQWDDGKLTVWTATQSPQGVHRELMAQFNLPPQKARVIVPDFGGGFGGKHTGECAVETARLAAALHAPVHVRWTREEEFTWAYFRPAGAIDAQASLDAKGALTSWYFVNINSGPNEVQTPYRAGRTDCRFVRSDPPLRQGSYRGLATTANTFARECFMDELATLAGRDPLEFRLAHLQDGRLRDVLMEAARRFDWKGRSARKIPGHGVGLSCGIDKGSFVAACVEAAVDPADKTIRAVHVCQVFDCGKVVNPSNLLLQVEGAILMGLGAALREEIRFDKGKILNAALSDYQVPRFADVPTLDVHLLDRPDVPSAGAGETPIIAIAPALANAVFAATGTRLRAMPLALPRV
jgi:isoquinoline 1-oxidoreductase